ncbi:MAG: FAD binding domain-containing protein [Bacteroidales bacterium]|nr:FAD binding domain-containing protein [Bacteroidales bacterium]
MIIDEYKKPKTIEEAYSILTTKENSQIIGGGAYMRLSKKHIGTAVDLSNLKLDFITETENYIEIGATTTLRELEINDITNKYFNGIISKSIKNIVGVQLRNIATVGGSIAGKFGFSDLIAALSVLDSKVILYKTGAVNLLDFINKKHNDVIEKIIITKNNLNADFQSIRNTKTDYAILNVAVSKHNNNFYKIAVGARPGIAICADKAESFLKTVDFSKENAEKAGLIASEEIKFTSNFRASAEYRQELCKTLVSRAILNINC